VIQKDYKRQLLKMLNADPDDLQDPNIQTAQAADPVLKRSHDISIEELNRILAAHGQWLESDGKIGQRANLSQINLQGANLASVNLQRANLAGANLLWINSFGAELQGADLSGADLRESYLEEANLQGAILKGADLREAYLVGANFQGSDLTRANLQQANLRTANLKNANLVMANLQDASLLNANLSFAKLQHANLKHVKISYADFENADLSGVTGLVFPQLSTVKNLSKAKLGAALKRQIRNRPQPLENPRIPEATVPAGDVENKPLKNRPQNDKDTRKLPRRPFSKRVFIASQNQYCKGLIKNINSFGAFIETTAKFYRRQALKLEIPGTKTDNATLIIGEVARTDLRGIGIKFKKLIQRSRFSQDMGGMRSGTERRKLLVSEYYPEKRSSADRRGLVDRRKLKYFTYYKYGLQLNRIIDNGGRRFARDRRQQLFGLYWPESRKGRDRRSGKDRRTAFETKKTEKTPKHQPPQKTISG